MSNNNRLFDIENHWLDNSVDPEDDGFIRDTDFEFDRDFDDMQAEIDKLLEEEDNNEKL